MSKKSEVIEVEQTAREQAFEKQRLRLTWIGDAGSLAPGWEKHGIPSQVTAAFGRGKVRGGHDFILARVTEIPEVLKNMQDKKKRSHFKHFEQYSCRLTRWCRSQTLGTKSHRIQHFHILPSESSYHNSHLLVSFLYVNASYLRAIVLRVEIDNITIK